MVHFRRSGLHHRGFGHGGGHDTGARISLLRSGAAKVCSYYDMGLHGLVFRHYFPMVSLGAIHWPSRHKAQAASLAISSTLV